MFQKLCNFKHNYNNPNETPVKITSIPSQYTLCKNKHCKCKFNSPNILDEMLDIHRDYKYQNQSQNYIIPIKKDTQEIQKCPCPFLTAVSSLNKSNIIFTTQQLLMDTQFQNYIVNLYGSDTIVFIDNCILIDQQIQQTHSRYIDQTSLNKAYIFIQKMELEIQKNQQETIKSINKFLTNPQVLLWENKKEIDSLSLQLDNIMEQIIEGNDNEESKNKIKELEQQKHKLEFEIMKLKCMPGNLYDPKFCIKVIYRYIYSLSDFLSNKKYRKKDLQGLAEVKQLKEFLFEQQSGQNNYFLNLRDFKFIRQRFIDLLITYKMDNYEEYKDVIKLIEFGSILATENIDDLQLQVSEDQKKMQVQGSDQAIYDKNTKLLKDQRFLFKCSMKLKKKSFKNNFDQILDNNQSVVLMSKAFFSSTIQIEKFLDELQIKDRVQIYREINQLRFKIQDTCLNIPLVITKSQDQSIFNSKSTNPIEIAYRYGNLIQDISSIIPDGMIVFFSSTRMMRQVLQYWKNDENQEDNFLKNLYKNSIIFIESDDDEENIKMLKLYQNSINSGRGGILFASLDGQIARTQIFQNHYARLILFLGFRDKFSNERSNFPRMKQLVNALSTVVNDRFDYCACVFVDEQFSKLKLNDFLPKLFQSSEKEVTKYVDIHFAQALIEIKKMLITSDHETINKEQFIQKTQNFIRHD